MLDLNITPIRVGGKFSSAKLRNHNFATESEVLQLYRSCYCHCEQPTHVEISGCGHPAMSHVISVSVSPRPTEHCLLTAIRRFVFPEVALSKPHKPPPDDK